MKPTPISTYNARDLRKQAEFQRVVAAAALSPNNRHVACGSTEGFGFTIKNPDGSIGNDGTVTLLDYVSNEMVGKFPTTRCGELIFRLAYNASGKYLACIAGDGLYIWDVEALDLILKQPIDGMHVMFADLEFVRGKQGECLFFAYRNQVEVFDLNRWQVVNRLKCWQGVDAQALVWAPDASRVATLNTDKKFAAVWNLQTGMLEWTQTTGGTNIMYSRSICFHPSGTLLAVGEKSRIVIWKIPQGELVCELRFEKGLNTESLAFSPDGTVLAAGLLRLESGQDQSGDWEVYGTRLCTLWDWEWGAQLIQLLGVGSSLAFSADGSRLAVTDAYSVEIWAVE